MNLVMKSLANLARNFLAYVEEKDTVEQPVSQLAQSVRPRMPKPVLPPTEQWYKLNIPGRDVWVSNQGQMKALRNRGTRSEILLARKNNQHKDNCPVCEVTVRYEGKTRSLNINVAKTVLIAFGDRPEWADDFPLVYKKSTEAVIFKDGNKKNCRIENLEWASRERANRLNYSLRNNLKHGKSGMERDHLAVFTGDLSFMKNHSVRGKKKDVVEEAAQPEIELPTASAEPTPLKEEWRDVPEFVGFYQVSNMGEVRSLTRWVHRYGGQRLDQHNPMYLTEEGIKKYDRKNYRLVRGRTLKPLTIEGKPGVNLCRDGVVLPLPIAQIVVESFYPERKAKGLSFRYEHVDGDVSNNRLDNLRFI